MASTLLVLVLLYKLSMISAIDDQYKLLKVGEEIKGETLPLRLGQQLYKLSGLRKSVGYEVKISYPASIPASFSIRLVRGKDELGLGKNRRLLNTEKLIFRADGEEAFVVVRVEAEGIVAKPNAKEREVVLYNIVCDKLVLGIPDNAWWVGIAAMLCLLTGFIVPYFFPIHLLLRTESLESRNEAMTKVS